MENVEGQNGFAIHFEVKPKFACAQSIKRTPSAMKAPERFPRIREVRRLQIADRLDDGELREFVELVELAHALFGKVELIHRGNSEVVTGDRGMRHQPRQNNNPMKRIFLLPALAAATLFLAPLSRAADAAAADSDSATTTTDNSNADVRAQRHAEFIKRFDTNGDGKLDENEKAVAKETLRQERSARADKMQARMLKKYDKNGDGVLDAAEQTAALADLETRPMFIKRFDKDGDGALNAVEKADAENVMRARWAHQQVAKNTPTPAAPAAANP